MSLKLYFPNRTRITGVYSTGLLLIVCDECCQESERRLTVMPYQALSLPFKYLLQRATSIDTPTTLCFARPHLHWIAPNKWLNMEELSMSNHSCSACVSDYSTAAWSSSCPNPFPSCFPFIGLNPIPWSEGVPCFLLLLLPLSLTRIYPKLASCTSYLILESSFPAWANALTKLWRKVVAPSFMSFSLLLDLSDH